MLKKAPYIPLKRRGRHHWGGTSMKQRKWTPLTELGRIQMLKNSPHILMHIGPDLSSIPTSGQLGQTCSFEPPF